MKAAVFITDARMLQVAKRLSEKQYEIIIVKDYKECESIYQMADTFDLVILPIQGVDKHGMIQFRNKSYNLSEHFKRWKKTVHLYTGINTSFLIESGYQVTALMDKEEVILANAKLTAEGILYMLILNTPRSIFEYKVDVIGYGHCGKEIVEILNKLKIETRIISAQLLKITDSKVSVMTLEQWKSTQPYPVIINTAPTLIINTELISQWLCEPIVIDLASNGMGVEDKVVNQKKVLVFKAPPLPGLLAPISAGDIYASAILKEENR